MVQSRSTNGARLPYYPAVIGFLYIFTIESCRWHVKSSHVPCSKRTETYFSEYTKNVKVIKLAMIIITATNFKVFPNLYQILLKKN